MVAPTCFDITLSSSGSVPSAFWEMLNWGAVDRILWMDVMCLVTWCVAIWVLPVYCLLSQTACCACVLSVQSHCVFCLCIVCAVTLRVLPVYCLCSHTACSACSNVSEFCPCLHTLFRATLQTKRHSNSAVWPTVFAFRAFLTFNNDYSLTRQFIRLSKFTKISSDCFPPKTEFKSMLCSFLCVLHTQSIFHHFYVRRCPTRHISSYLFFYRRRKA
jgi:hypothetical protein